MSGAVLVGGCTTSIGGSADAAGDGQAGTGASQPSSAGDGGSASFDPCTDLADEQLSGAGLSPSTKENADVANGDLGRGCGWDGDGVLASILVTDQTVDTISSRSDLLNVSATTVAGVQGVQFQLSNDGDCGVAVNSGDVSVAFIVTLRFASVGSVDPCAAADKIAVALAPLVPK